MVDVELHGGVLFYMVGIVGLHGGIAGLHGGMLGYMVGCWVTWMYCLVASWWKMLGYMVGILGYVGGLHGGVLGYMMKCWVIWWHVGLHGEECCVIWGC